MKLSFGIIQAIILLISLGFRQVAGSELDDLIREALDRNSEILAAKERWEAAEAKISSARAWPDPRVGIRFEKNPGPAYSLGEARMRMYTFSQTIPFPGKLSLRAEMYRKDAHGTRWEYEATRQEIVAQVKTAYYDLYVLQKSLDIIQEQIGLLQAFEKTAQAKYAVGETSQHDVLKAQVELALLREERQTLQQERLLTARERLNTLLNRPADSPEKILGHMSVPAMTLDREQLERMALDHRPALTAEEEMVAKTKAAHTLAKMGYLPDLNVTVMQERMKTPLGEETTQGLGFSLNIPLWFWGNRAEVSEKKHLWLGAQAMYQDLKKQVLFHVHQALAEYRSAERRSELFQTTIVPLAEQSLKAARVAYEHREIDFLNLISAESNLREARLKQYQAMGKLGKSLARLEQVVGITLGDEKEMD